MATISKTPDDSNTEGQFLDSLEGRKSSGGIWDSVVTVLRPLASLKLTVFLLLLATFATWVVTLEQNHVDFWHVKKKNFASPYIQVPFSLFFIPKWAPSYQNLPGYFIMPSGFTIIIAMLINLGAAHLIRFKLQARGARLVIGLIATVFATVLTWAVIFHGQSPEGFQKQPPITYKQMWMCMQIGLLAVAVGAGAGIAMLGVRQKVERVVLGIAALACAATLVSTLILGENAFIGDSGMRIVWQLAQSTAAALAGLGACVLLFNKRAGIVLLHIGVAGLLMNEIYVSVTNEESQMAIEENQSVSLAEDIRYRELVFINQEDPETDEIIVVPASKFKVGGVIQHADLPFDLKCEAFYPNSNVSPPSAEDVNPATEGLGMRMMATSQPISTGIEMDTPPDMASGYFTLTDKTDGSQLGTYLVSQNLFMKGFSDTVTANGKKFQIGMRFKTLYKPYTITLNDVQRINYPGTNTPKWFSSDIEMNDHEKDVEVAQKIWMNNPLRFGDETFYQASYGQFKNGGEYTVLQIVRNRGWMIPYVCCMFTFVGLVWQFGNSLLAYLEKDRRQAAREIASGVVAIATGMSADIVTDKKIRGEAPKSQEQLMEAASKSPGEVPAAELLERLSSQKAKKSKASWLVPLAIVAIFGGYVAGKMGRGMSEKVVSNEMRLDRLGEIPITYEGRVQPLDSLARNLARQLSNRELVEDGKTEPGKPAETDSMGRLGTRQPAIKWFVDTIFEAEGYELYRVLRIEDLNVLAAMKLEQRKGFRYSIREVKAGYKNIVEAIRTAIDTDPKARDGFQNRLLEVDSKLNRIRVMQLAFASSTSKLKNEDDVLERLSMSELIVKNGSTRWPLAGPVGKGDVAEIEDEPWVSLPTLLDRRWLAGLAEEYGATTPTELALAINGKEFGDLREQMIKHEVIRKYTSDPQMLETIKKMTGLESAEEVQAQLNDNWERFPKELLERETKAIGPLVDAQLDTTKQRLDKLTREQIELIMGAKTELGKYQGEKFKALSAIEPAFRAGDAEGFNSAVETYLAANQANPPHEAKSHRMTLAKRMAFEKVYNRTSPFHWSMVLYLFAALLTIGSWIGYTKELNRAAFWMIVVGLLIQTFGICLRVGISGRAPITNLYSSYLFVSAVFILVLLIVERITKTGVGNLMAAKGGFSALMWAWSMSIADGDTFTVMRAVLDTQFWLSTHVVCISTGYATTVAAGFLGAGYLVAGVLTPSMNASKRKMFANLIYGIVCFGLLFSFFGTVLGGLWADDSWGRFWGWDPKENGALMIVLWNAVILHARWAGMIKLRGLASCSVIGTIITVWSWEAVNQMGVGLHAYGGSGGGRMQIIGWFWAVNAVIALMGLIPTKYWLSFAAEKSLEKSLGKS